MKKNISFLNNFKHDNTLLSSIKLYKHFIFYNQKKNVLVLLLIAFISGLVPVIDGLYLQNITDSIEKYSDKDLAHINLASALFKWIFIYAAWWEGQNIMWRLYDYCYLKAMPHIKAHVIDEFYNHAQYHSHKFFQSNLAGNITNRITEASRSIEMIFAGINEKMVRKFSGLVFAVITLYIVHPTIATIFISWLIAFVSISIYFSKTINSYSKIFSKNKAIVAGKIVDSIANISVVRMFSSHKHEHHYLRKYLNNSIQSDQALQWFMFKLRYVLGTSCTIMIGCIIYYTIMLRSDLHISTGQAVLIITLCISVIGDIWDLTQELGDLFEQIGAFNQSLSLLNADAIKDAPDALELVIKTPIIEFKDVTFNFTNTNNNTNIFKNQNIIIEPYQKIGLAGFSGSGKTTFTNLISRLYEIDGGTILIDGQDISKISQDSLHKNISVIPQEPILFHRSIKENICYNMPNASFEEMVNAARAARAHDFIMNLPQQYDTICGERGNNLSGGQRQLISIARSFLKNAPILILDEATSALDNYTEKLIQESLNKLMINKTVIVIAHRLFTLLNMDKILVFNKGHIVEQGTHEELKNNGKIYKMLWTSY